MVCAARLLTPGPRLRRWLLLGCRGSMLDAADQLVNLSKQMLDDQYVGFLVDVHNADNRRPNHKSLSESNPIRNNRRIYAFFSTSLLPTQYADRKSEDWPISDGITLEIRESSALQPATGWLRIIVFLSVIRLQQAFPKVDLATCRVRAFFATIDFITNGIQPANPNPNQPTYSTYGMKNAAKRLRGKSFGQRTGRFPSPHARRTNFRRVLAQGRAAPFYVVQT